MAPESTTRATTAGLAAMHGKFLQFLRGKTGDSATAEDILQSAYLKAMEHGAELRETESSVAWFYRILRNAVADHYRRMEAQSRAMDQFAATWQEGYEPELQEETCACIQEAVRNLNPEYRAAIEQVDLAGGSVESFAGARNTTVNNAYVRLHRARKAVAKQLVAICGTCSEHKCIDCTCKSRGRETLKVRSQTGTG
jgi:RNA polymerase sigma factor (sigma-70 family)